MSGLREAAQQALKALEAWPSPKRNAVIKTLRAALEQPTRAQKMRDAGFTRRPTIREMSEQPEQEPVAWMVYTQDGKSVCVTDNPADFIEWRSFPLFTYPPRREWRGLTYQEIDDLQSGMQATFKDICAIEAALKEKNHE